MPVLTDAIAAIASGVIRCNPATIRSWAHRGYIKKYGSDKRGRTLYDLHELIEYFENGSDKQS